MRLNRDDFRDKVLGCWLGKNIGGTLGAPMEWRRQLNDVSFYTQDLGGEPLPNDDLDIQLLWLRALEEKGIDIDAQILADYWCLYVTPHWCEYGTGKINMRQGMLPPVCGSYKNEYKHSCGAFIRSEIWACICPGRPDLAAKYCYEDAILDHGDGEGTYAEVFVGALEAAAFVVDDLRKLIEIGLSYIPAECETAKAVLTAIEAVDGGLGWVEARDLILERHRGGAFFKLNWLISERDQAKGFHEGELGFDVPSNIGMTVLGLLIGGHDFDKMLCTTVNCGEDTDCTGATAGSIYGIIHGAKNIPERWIEPIGRNIKVACLNVGELGGMQAAELPLDVDSLTDRTEKLAWQVSLRRSGLDLWSTEPTNLSDVNPNALMCPDGGASLYKALRGPKFEFPDFNFYLDYVGGPEIRDGEPKTVKMTIQNTYKVQSNLSLHWYLPEGWEASPSADGYVMSLHASIGYPQVLTFQITAPKVTRSLCRAALEVSIEGRPTVMLIPLQFVNGNMNSIDG